MTGGNDLKKHDLAEFQLDTESGQGILFTNTGMSRTNASVNTLKAAD